MAGPECQDKAQCSRKSQSDEGTPPGEWKVALSDLGMSRDVMHGSELHYGVVFLSPVKVIIPSHIGHAIVIKE